MTTNNPHPNPLRSFLVRRSEPDYAGVSTLFINFYDKHKRVKRQQLSPVFVEDAEVEEGDVIWIQKPNKIERGLKS